MEYFGKPARARLFPAAAAAAKVLKKYQQYLGNKAMDAVLILSRIGTAAKPAVPMLLAALGGTTGTRGQG